MNAWLVVNGFIGSKKFHEIYTFLSKAAEKRGIHLDIKTNDILASVPIGERICKDEHPDFVLFWDKDIRLAKRLESEGLRLFNTASAIEICDNKILTAESLSGYVRIPKTIISPLTFEGIGYKSLDFVENATRVVGLPMIIKEAYGSFGAQVYLASTLEDAKGIVTSLGHKPFIMQEFVSESSGRDMRVNVVGDKIISAMERYNANDFRSNISNGGSMRKATLTPEIEEAAISASHVLGLDFAGVDVLFGKDGPIICEVNSNPHFKSSLECTGIDMSEAILDHVLEQLK